MESQIEEVQSKQKDKGFTLVELLIVIVILGILATVTVFAVRGITDKGKTSACAADKKTLEVAAEAYFANYGGSLIPTTATAVPTGAVPVPTGVIPGTTPAATLAASGLLRDVSTTNWTLAADGSLTAVPLGPCV
jgi:prepilin-type N-terminal cleavage/methylation domain-containing protein